MKIIVFNDNNRFEYSSDNSVLLSDIVKKSGFDFSMVCAGNGKCGKCFAEVSGIVSEPSEAEKMLLGDKLSSGFRLLCMTYSLGDCEIHLSQETISGTTEIKNDDEVKNPITSEKSCFVRIVDIGTTTVASYYYKMPDGVLLKTVLQKNSQTVFGSDVVSRIAYAALHGTDELSCHINNQLKSIDEEARIKPDFSVITGNSAMLYFYKNIKTDSLAKAPFYLTERFGNVQNNECIPMCISPFIGADITCGIISSGMLQYEKSMLIDIGTNGEIAYKNSDEIICCSAAAGPAFEGSGIKNGCVSVGGAINYVYNVGNRLFYTTIDDKKPMGICGSGIISAIASLLRAGIIDKDGFLEKNYMIGDSGIEITPEDIRQVQLAKASVRAAVETVCDDLRSVERFFISGSFGSYLNIDDAIYMGLLPREMKGKISLCGNTAADGARMIFFHRALLEKSNLIAKNAKTLTLASNDDFYKKYLEYMNF